MKYSISLFSIFFALGVMPELSAQGISDVYFRQAGDKVIVNYHLDSPHPEDRYTVKLYYSPNGGRTFRSVSMVSGDVGTNISRGRGKEISWQAVQEEGRFYNASVRFRVQAEMTVDGNLEASFSDYRDRYAGDMIAIDGPDTIC